jgi:hypothetical protein
MAVFGLPFGPVDPNLLPALLRQQMASPAQIPGPVPAQQLTPGFRVPPTMGAPAGMSPMPQAQPGFNVQDGADMLSKGLAGWKPKPQGVPEDAGIPGSNAAAQAAAARYGPAAVPPGFTGTIGDATNAVMNAPVYSNVGDPMSNLGLGSDVAAGAGAAGVDVAAGSAAAAGDAGAAGLSMADLLPFLAMFA